MYAGYEIFLWPSHLLLLIYYAVPMNYNFCSQTGTKTNRPFYSCVLSYQAINASKAGGDLALMQTSLLFSFKCQLVSIRTTSFTQQSSEVCIKTRSPQTSLPFKGQVTDQTTVKWSRSKWFEPRSINSSYSVIFRASVVLKRTVVGDYFFLYFFI